MLSQIQKVAVPQRRLGVAELTRIAFQGSELAPIESMLLAAIDCDKSGAAALMDLSVVEQLNGNIGGGLDRQSAALARCQLFETVSNVEPNLDLLVLAAPIRMGSNTPVEFLVARARIRLTTLYCVPGTSWPQPLPAHDIAFVAAPGDCGSTRAYLREIKSRLDNWPRPILNRPNQIAGLERDQLCLSLADLSGVVAPNTVRCSRATLTAAALDRQNLSDELPLPLPAIVRPVGSHAGDGLEKLPNHTSLENYLLNSTQPEFFVSEFVDYRSTDGAFRKYRIIFVDGQPYPCHMAIANQWNIWYLNADMQQDPAKRHEEQQFMDQFENEFGSRHASALSAIADRVDLEYFGIDCAELADGRLVVFEADNALIVHDMDPPDLFPYKSTHMHNIFSAFEQLLRCKATTSQTLQDELDLCPIAAL